MKNLRSVLFIFLLGALLPVTTHADKVAGGPKGGRLFDTTPARVEFVVTPEGKAEIIFYDAALQAVAPGTQVVTVTAEAPGGRSVLELDRTATGFVSRQPLPGGTPYRVVVQVRAAPGEKPQNHRVDLDLGPCGECSRAEYACICEGH